MVAPSKIRYMVLAVPLMAEDLPLPRSRESWDLVPGADPYIHSLIEKLQAEVRRERACRLSDPPGLGSELINEAELPWNEDQYDYDPMDDDRHLPDFDDGKSDIPARR